MSKDYELACKLLRSRGQNVFSGVMIREIAIIKTLKRLAKKHQDLAVMDCNGVGIIKGQVYYNGAIDDYAKREYGNNVKSAYLDDETTVFDKESIKISDKIDKLIKNTRFRVEYQGDPRGATVRLFSNADDLTGLLY